MPDRMAAQTVASSLSSDLAEERQLANVATMLCTYRVVQSWFVQSRCLHKSAFTKVSSLLSAVHGSGATKPLSSALVTTTLAFVVCPALPVGHNLLQLFLLHSKVCCDTHSAPVCPPPVISCLNVAP